jgi:hypothetical protein
MELTKELKNINPEDSQEYGRELLLQKLTSKYYICHITFESSDFNDNLCNRYVLIVDTSNSDIQKIESEVLNVIASSYEESNYTLEKCEFSRPVNMSFTNRVNGEPTHAYKILKVEIIPMNVFSALKNYSTIIEI